ncbi:hypothetical protein OBBRIDRAFT_790242 [Obba rivulosa]|uniref:Uncharacterized protein n=1 Tax=Obba rivulosa TaxID=1052685 RepID=A0A8E2DPW0_9APHY|nr:hypothetical protein OBBRIDRAFT_790242 [Obba rivulosa]
MPKRIPTPPPGDDEPKYLSVVHPYPAHANMEFDKDRKTCAFWISCCIGRENLLSLYHKPSSPNLVIIEVRREYPDFDNILGEHRWSEFLKNPSSDDKKRVSQVFYCTLSTGRQVQKNGWKNIVVEEHWFQLTQWATIRNLVKSSYPRTHYCAQPPEDKTRYSLCRPLPVVSFPPPPPVRLPPVGSPEWLEWKKTEALPRVQVPLRSGGSATRPSIAVLSTGVVGSEWDSAGVSSASSSPSVATPASATTPWGVRPNLLNSGHFAPPGIAVPSAVSRSGSSNASSAGSSIRDIGPPPGLVHPARPLSEPLSSTSSETDSVIFSPNPDYNPYADNDVRGTGVAGITHAFGNISLANQDEELLDEADWGVPVVPSYTGPPTSNGWKDDGEGGARETDTGSLWKDYDKPKPPPPAEFQCPVHQNKCAKGICAEYGKEKRRREWERQKAERAATKASQQESWRNKDNSGKGYDRARGRLEHSAGSRSPRLPAPMAAPPSRQKPAHLLRATEGANANVTPPVLAPRPADQWMHVRNVIAKLPAQGPPSAGASTASKWGKISNGPWGSVAGGARPVGTGGDAKAGPASSAGTHTVNGGAPAWGRQGPPNAALSGDARSVAESVASAWSAKSTPWGRNQGKAPAQKIITEAEKNVRSWADEMDEEDGRSVAAESEWGNLSNGPQ